jgi:tetratricopeptide (TPR) repeat protein
MFVKRLVLASVCCLALGCHNSAERAQDYLTKGMNYYKQGDYAKARIELKNVLQIDAKKADAFYYLALMDEKEQNWPAMFTNLSQTVALNPKNNEAHLKLGQMQLLSEDPNSADKALEQVNSILKNSPNDPGAFTLKAQVLFKRGQPDQAQAIVAQVLKLQPDFLDALRLKTIIFLAKNDIPAALLSVNNALAMNPNEVSFYLLKLQIHEQSKNTAAVEQDFLELIKRFPDKLEFNYRLAKYYADKNQEDKAAAVLQNTIKKNPTELTAKLNFVDYLISKKSGQVEATLKAYLIPHPNEPELIFRLAQFYLQQQKLTQAKQTLELIVAHKKDSKEALAAKMLLATIALDENKQNQPAAALAILKEILAVEPTYFEALMLQAKITLSQGQLDEAVSQIRNIISNYPKSDQAMVLLAKAYAKQNDPELAKDSFHKALDLNPNNLDALLPIIAELIQNKDFSRAAELVQRGLDRNPRHLELLQTMAKIKLAGKDWAGVQKVAESFAKQPSTLGFAHYLNGKILQSQQKYADAIVKYKEAFAAKPELLEALKGVVECYESLNQRDAIFAYLDSLMKTYPNQPNFWLLKAQFLAFDKRPAEASKLLTAAIAKWPKTAEFYIQLAKLSMLPQESDQAIAIYHKALAITPEHIELQLNLAALYEQKADYASAIKIYETVLAKQANTATAANNLASLLLDHYPTKANIERAAKLAAAFANADEPYFLDTYAWSLIQSGREGDALTVLQKIVAQAPEVAVFRYHLAVAYHKTQEDTAAVSELEQALVLGEKMRVFAEKKAIENLLAEIKMKK